MTFATSWTAVPMPEDAEKDLTALLTAANSSKDQAAVTAAKLAQTKYVAWKKVFTQTAGDGAAKKSKADTAMGGPAKTAYNAAATKVSEVSSAASAGPMKFKVIGNMPAQPQNMPPAASASYEKAEKIYNAMKAGKNPKQAVTTAGVSEDPTIIPSKDKKSGVYHFRLSHGGTQYRLDATYAVKGDTTEVKFTGVGRGH